jgi:hypothetical protein
MDIHLLIDWAKPGGRVPSTRRGEARLTVGRVPGTSRVP